MSESMHHLSLLIWFTSLSVSFLVLPIYLKISLLTLHLQLNSISLYAWYGSHFHYLCIRRRVLSCFYLPAIVNRIAMDIAEQESVVQDVKSSGHMPRSGIPCSSHSTSKKLPFAANRAHYRKTQLVIIQRRMDPGQPSSNVYIYNTTSAPKAQRTSLKRAQKDCKIQPYDCLNKTGQ